MLRRPRAVTRTKSWGRNDVLCCLRVARVTFFHALIIWRSRYLEHVREEEVEEPDLQLSTSRMLVIWIDCTDYSEKLTCAYPRGRGKWIGLCFGKWQSLWNYMSGSIRSSQTPVGIIYNEWKDKARKGDALGNEFSSTSSCCILYSILQSPNHVHWQLKHSDSAMVFVLSLDTV